MIILDSTSDILELLSTAAVSTDYYISYVDITTTAYTPGVSDGNISTATTTTILAAPASSTQRQVKYISITNRSTTTAQGVTVKYDVSGTERYLTPSVTLGAGETYQYTNEGGWQVLDRNGRVKTNANELDGYNGRSAYLYKVGTAPEAAATWYCWAKDSGTPGAWAPGTPGVAGRTTDGTTSTDAGCLLIANPSTGANYLVQSSVAASVAHFFNLFDVLWVNSGLVVTTTTAQTVNSVTFPARDVNGSTNGEGVFVGILVTTATTNVGAVTNTTMSYTNSDGTAGHTATIASFPATAVIGTFVPFQLQAGDRGVRSIQSVTLGTSYAAGAISIIAYRPLDSQPMLVANTGTPDSIPTMNPGIRLYNGTCALPFGLMNATTATTVTGNFKIMER